MAQDIVGGLFGLNTQPDYSAQDYRTAVAMAEMNSPKQMGRFLGGMIGAPVGRAVAQGIGGLMGVEDPRLAQASAIKEAQMQGFDVTTPEGLQQLAQFFVQKGQPGLASQVATQAQTMSRAASEEEYKKAQAYAAVKKADAERLSNTARMLVERGFTPGTPEFQAEMTRAFNADVTGKAKGDGVNVNLGGFVDKVFNKAAADKEGEEVGKQITAWGKIAANAPQSLQTANTAIDLIDKAFTGAGAESLMNLSKFARQLGVPVSDKASNTEISVALTKKLISEQGRTFPGSQSNLELQQILQKNPNALQEPRTQRYLWDLYKQDVRTAKESYRSAQEHKKAKGSYAGYDVYEGGAQASQSIIDKTNRYNQLSQKARTTGTLTPQEAREAKQLEADLGENR